VLIVAVLVIVLIAPPAPVVVLVVVIVVILIPVDIVAPLVASGITVWMPRPLVQGYMSGVMVLVEASRAACERS
jgi:hypothetical protein